MLSTACRLSTALAVLAIATQVSAAPPTDAQRCESYKLTAQSKFAQCRLKADSTYAKNLDAAKRTTAYGKCTEKLVKAHGIADTKYGAACPTPGDEPPVEAFLQACTDKTAAWASGSLAAPLAFERFPATGQTNCYAGGSLFFQPAVAPCAGTGQDGDAAAGAALNFVDNGDGTVTDRNTGLMWEKKSDDGSLHDFDNCYPWVGTCSGDATTWCSRDADCAGPGGTCDVADCQSASPGGITAFEWIAQLNAANFAGHADWRLPNRRELDTLVDFANLAPAVSAQFNTGCNPGCSVTTCSCTKPNAYISSTTHGLDAQFSWGITFDDGDTSTRFKESPDFVRAVRGGS